MSRQSTHRIHSSWEYLPLIVFLGFARTSSSFIQLYPPSTTLALREAAIATNAYSYSADHGFKGGRRKGQRISILPAPAQPRYRTSFQSRPFGNLNRSHVDRTIASSSLTIRGGSAASSTACDMLPAAIASLVSGSVAGAVGVGVAFPLDTLKTKAQVMSSTATSVVDASETGAPANLNMIQMFQLIYRMEGVSGFFSGVRTMMIGQAFIKAVAFSSNGLALYVLQHYAPVSESAFVQQFLSAPVLQLIVAACFAGFVSSFLVNPVERIKVMMQASGTSMYKNELQCIDAVLQKEGWKGLLGRGLGPTLAREVPSYAIYFVVYGILSDTYLAKHVFGPTLSPLIFGAISGMACWIPVYPVDVVKTLLQNSEGDDGNSVWSITRKLYEEGGIGAFFDGLTPKMLRAAVNHSVTFYLYDLIMRALVA